jgi:hypothetical protein
MSGERTTTKPGPIRSRLRHLPSGLRATAVLLPAGAAAGLLFGGVAAGLGAAFGVLLVAASFSVSSVIIAWADSINPQLVLPVGLLTYALKFTLLGFTAVVLAATGWAGLPAFGLGMAAATLAWATAQAWWTWHAKILYVDPES